ncbi:MAG: hypothetical protein WCT10_00570 [Patescibacteria group bacterium]|jgi:hypothetical protein
MANPSSPRLTAFLITGLLTLSGFAVLPVPAAAEWDCLDACRAENRSPKTTPFSCPSTPSKAVCGSAPNYSCYLDAKTMCPDSQKRDCGQANCPLVCNTGYPCGSVPNCTAATSVAYASCSGTSGCPVNGVFTGQCSQMGCPSGQSVCSGNNTCMVTSCSPGFIFNSSTCACDTPFIQKNLPSGDSGSAIVQGDIKSTAGNLVLTSTANGQGDIYLPSGKAIRVDDAGPSILNLGNWGGGTFNLIVDGLAQLTALQLATDAGAGKVLTSDATGIATWQTFASGLSGNGTTNQVAKFTGVSTLGDSTITDDGVNVGIGDTTPEQKLSVDGGLFVDASGNAHAIADPNIALIVDGAAGKDILQLRDVGANTKLTVKDSGIVVVGGTTPAAGNPAFEVQGGSVLFSGNVGATPTSGNGFRLMWIPVKGAFRAGYGYSDYWDDANIGYYSAAFGSQSKASGQYSFAAGNGQATMTGATAIGYSVVASGNWSSALGYVSTASGNMSFSAGGNNLASGYAATTLGRSNTASGNYSIAMGYTSTATSINSVAIGTSNTVSGNYSVALGYMSAAPGYNSVAIGNSATAGAAGVGPSFAIGTAVSATGQGSIAIGSGLDTSQKMVNAANNTFTVGLNSTVPTLTVSGGNGTVGSVGTVTVAGSLGANGGVTVDGAVVIDDGAGWHRTYGDTGWYNGTYAGGWYMTDPTYVRSYNAKSVLAPALVDQNDATYYVDPNSISKLNAVVARAFVDFDDAAKYVNPSDVSYMNTIHLTGDVTLNNTLHVSSEWSQCIYNGQGNPLSYYIRAKTGRDMCFLTWVGLRDIDGADEDSWCKVVDAGSYWAMEIETDDDSDACCAARCLYWDE